MNEQEKALCSMVAARMAYLALSAPTGAEVWKRSVDVGKAFAFFARALGMQDDRAVYVMAVADRYASLLYRRFRS